MNRERIKGTTVNALFSLKPLAVFPPYYLKRCYLKDAQVELKENAVQRPCHKEAFLDLQLDVKGCKAGPRTRSFTRLT